MGVKYRVVGLATSFPTPNTQYLTPSSRLLIARRIAQCGLRRCQPRDRHAVWAARDIGQADFVAEHHAAWLAAVLTADADLQIRAGRSTALGAHLYELSDALLVEHLERIILQQLALDIRRQEAPGIIA